MRIKIEFSNNWSIEDMKQYLSDIENERTLDMYYDEQLELAACSYIYSENPNLSQEEIIHDAQEDIEQGIDEFFFCEMCHNYISSYNQEIKEKQWKEPALK